MNVHKRCQKNVANNCGINTKQMAEILSGMGISSANLQRKKKPSISESKVRNYDESTEEIRLRFEAQRIMEERERVRQQQHTGAGKEKETCSPVKKDTVPSQQSEFILYLCRLA